MNKHDTKQLNTCCVKQDKKNAKFF